LILNFNEEVAGKAFNKMAANIPVSSFCYSIQVKLLYPPSNLIFHQEKMNKKKKKNLDFPSIKVSNHYEFDRSKVNSNKIGLIYL